MKTKKETVCLSCSIFKKELDRLKKEGKISIDIHYLTSMLHMKPKELGERLTKLKNKLSKEEKNIVLLYGDCCPYMENIANEKNVIRTTGINCIEILLGKEHFRKLRKEGAFFLMPEWTLRWEEVFKFELKLEGDIAIEFMREFHTKIIYLDTEQIDIPYKQIKEIEEYTGLKVEILKADIEELNLSLENAFKELNTIEKNKL